MLNIDGFSIHKKYIKKANRFIFDNKPVVVIYLLLLATSTITGLFLETDYDKYSILTFISIILSFLFLKYTLLLPKLIHESGNSHRISSKQLINLLKNQNWKTLKAFLYILLPYGFVIGLYQFLISSLLGTPLFGVYYGQQRLNNEFGFYPREVFDMFVMILVAAPLYIFPIAYFVNDFSLWQSFKESIQFTIKHKKIIFPMVSLYGIYFAIAYLFMNQSNYYALPSRFFVETYLGLLLIVAIYFYYMEHSTNLKS